VQQYHRRRLGRSGVDNVEPKARAYEVIHSHYPITGRTTLMSESSANKSVQAGL
jgi:hypothetical protein